MLFDFVIIGSGPAGSILAWRLAKLNFNIALVDQANSKKKIINDYFLPYVNKSPSHYNPVFSNRLGGNSVLVFMPTTSNASAGMTSLFVSSQGKQTATLSHANNGQTDRTYKYIIIG
mgnify:CR=1 FL=1